MSDLIKLKPRLQTCADFVRTGKKVADVGTDHAYLPVYLLQTNRVSFAVASDINKGPLDSAKANAARFSVLDKLSLRLSNGLAEINKEEVDDIVIAGMGGELILRIILETPWLFSTDKALVLQPMTKANVLRKGLAENGFKILKEQAVLEDKKIYSVMSVQFCGQKRVICVLEEYMGQILPSELYSNLYAQKVVSSLKKKLLGFTVDDQNVEKEALEAAITEIEEQYLK
ncbi:class I SAM-dependent methyltransferase [Scatolibacter rhodanostii]|uniref:class I SAM-dependent methyltransferase n=1 Tax=Scatolibacter rhodanostii TaxID=2014781 RepID=UPI000C0794CC|nr:class I SAM-dependent methyltransferase [Scatolibacter rhodanostii]